MNRGGLVPESRQDGFELSFCTTCRNRSWAGGSARASGGRILKVEQLRSLAWEIATGAVYRSIR
jgi:hypothetical protein